MDVSMNSFYNALYRMVDGNRVLRGTFANQSRIDPRDKKPDWPGPGGTEVPLQPTTDHAYTNGR